MTARHLTEWRESGARFSFQGHDIFYQDDGDGDVLLCLHGFPTASWDWHRVWPGLTPRFRVIAPDMIGFGFSAKPAHYDYSILDQATLHEALLGELGIRSVHILAHDYGDTVVQEMLARHLEEKQRGSALLTINSICFLNGGLFPESQEIRTIQRLLMTPLGPLIGRLLNRARFASSFRAVFGPETQPSETELDDFWSLLTFNEGHRLGHRIIRYLEERRAHRERWVSALVRADVPMRFIDGAADPVSGRAMAERYLQIVPDPDVVVLDGIGHYPQIEDPESTLSHFLAFVERVGTAASVVAHAGRSQSSPLTNS